MYARAAAVAAPAFPGPATALFGCRQMPRKPLPRAAALGIPRTFGATSADGSVRFRQRQSLHARIRNPLTSPTPWCTCPWCSACRPLFRLATRQSTPTHDKPTVQRQRSLSSDIWQPRSRALLPGLLPQLTSVAPPSATKHLPVPGSRGTHSGFAGQPPLPGGARYKQLFAPQPNSRHVCKTSFASPPATSTPHAERIHVSAASVTPARADASILPVVPALQPGWCPPRVDAYPRCVKPRTRDGCRRLWCRVKKCVNAPVPAPAR